jgi:hypothetical protein
MQKGYGDISLALGNLLNISYIALVPHFAMPNEVTHTETEFGFEN